MAEPTESTGGIPFVAVLCVEAYETGDGRYLEPGMGSWRELPQPLHFQTVQPEMGGHAGAEIAARIDSIRMDGRRMMAEGVFDDSDRGREYARLVHERMVRFVSIDVADADVVIEPVEFDEDGFPTETRARFGPYKIMGATATSHPAIDLAVIWLKSDPAPDELYANLPDPLGPPAPMPDMEPMLLLASASEAAPTLALVASGAVKPPAAWFEDPKLTELTKIRVTDEGRIFGHIAPWGCCHIGFLNRCVEPPKGSDYSRFLVGYRTTAEGTEVPTGTITAGGLHADDTLDEHAARAHHDDVSSAMGDVTIGEDDFGPWVAGAVRAGVTDTQIEMLRASGFSGDWRPIGGRLELINVHTVNTPGFPVPTMRARVASGELVSLTASIGTDGSRVGEALPEGVTREGTEVPLDETGVLNADADTEGQPWPVTEPTDAPNPLDTVLAPVLEAQRDELLERHPAPPEPSALQRYLASRE